MKQVIRVLSSLLVPMMIYRLSRKIAVKLARQRMARLDYHIVI